MKNNKLKLKRAQDQKVKLSSAVLNKVKAQEEKPKVSLTVFNKVKAQEEMTGFVLIVIIVAVLLLIFIGFAIRKPQIQEIESYEVNSYLQSVLQYTSDCSDNLGFLDIDKLIFSCVNAEECLNGKKSCDVLYTTLNEISKNSWKIQEKPEKAYEFKILLNGEDLIPMIIQGNKTSNYKGAVQDLSKSDNNVEVFFRAYY